MTIKGGDVSGLSSAYYNGGGAYIAAGTVTLDTIAISGSKAYGGGGIYNNNGTLTINSSTISSNSSTASGGGIYNCKTLTVNNSDISYNISGTNGAGLYINSSTNLVTIKSSTVSNNSGANGVGIYCYNSIVTVNSSTISNNSGTYSTFHISGSSTTVTITSSTISGNHVNSYPGVYLSSSNLYIVNSIVAYNYKNNSSSYNDLYAVSATIYGSYNIIGDWGDTELGGTGNIDYDYGTDGQGTGGSGTLFAYYTKPSETYDVYQPVLADNGGDTYTVALASDSIAISAGCYTGYDDISDGTSYKFSRDETNWYYVQGGGAALAPATTISVDQRGESITGTPSVGAYFMEPTQYYYKSDADGGNWNISSGDYTWTRCLTVDGTYEDTYIAPTVDNSISVTIVNGATVTITSSDTDVVMDNMTIDEGGSLVLNTTGSLTVNDGSEASDLTVNGILDMDGGSFTLGTGAALTYGSSSTLIYSDSAASQTTGSELLATMPGSLTLNNTNGVTVNSATAVSGTLTVASGTVLTTAQSITVSGETSGTGTVNASVGTITYNRAGDQTIFAGNYYDLVFNGAGNKTLTGDIGIENAFTITAGTFVHNDKTVTYNGGNQTVLALDYSTLSFTGSTASSTKTFADGITKVDNEIAITDMSIILTGSTGVGESSTVQVTTPGAGGTASRVFNINASGETVTISNMTIKGGDISGLSGDAAKGGGIYIAAGTVYLDTVTVSGSKANYGGGIYNNTGILNITSSTVSNNALYSGYAGGIYNAGGTVTVTSSIISSNSGGGIYNTGILNITSSTVSNNSGTIYGGGIYNSGGTVTINSSTVSNNSGTIYGGGIYNSGGTVTINSSTVSNNSAASGGIYNDSTLIITSSTVSGNTVYSGYGAGILNMGDIYLLSSAVAGNYGGDDIYSFSGTVTGYCSWVDNINTSLGGDHNITTDYTLNDLYALADYGGTTLTMLPGTASPVINAGTLTGTDTDGKACWYNQSDSKWYTYLNAETTVSTVNSEDQRGESRPDTASASTATIGSVQFQTGTEGDIVYVNKINDTDWIVVTTEDDIMDFDDGVVSLREALSFAASGSTITFADGVTVCATDTVLPFINRTLTVDGNDLVSISGDTDSDGNSDNLTGLLYIAEGGNLTLENITVTKGYSILGGGIFNNGSLTLTDSTVSSNTASSSGGGIYSSGTLTITDSTISNNTAVEHGGGINNSSGTLTLTNSTVSENTADSNGGGIYSSGTLTLTNSTVSENTADSSGGGIYCNGDTLITAGSTVNNNTAATGGGIYNTGSLTVTNSIVSSNSVGSRGGGIYNDGIVIVTDSTVNNNTAATGGGIFNTTGDTLTLFNSTVSNNTADSNGGGIYNRGSLTVTNSTVSSNTATGGDGGGIYADSVSTLQVITDSTISSNTAAGKGGGIYKDGAVLEVTSSTVSNNSADTGGGIYNFVGSLTVTSSTVSGNSAVTGGGIYNYSYNAEYQAKAYITNSIIAYNYLSDESAYDDIYSDEISVLYGNYNISGYDLNTKSGVTTNTTYNYGDDGQGGGSGSGSLFASYTEISSANKIYQPVLADNGGDTYTVALAVDSIAIGAGVQAGYSTTSSVYAFYDESSSTNWYSVVDGTTEVTVDAADIIDTDQRGESIVGTPSIGAYFLEVPQYYYKSDADGGNWNVSSGDYTWTRCLTVDGTYEDTYITPTLDNSISVTIVNGAIVTITSSDTDVVMDNMIIDEGGSLVLNTTGSLTVNDGSEANDLTVNGILDMDGGTFTLGTGAVLAYGSSSTLIYSDSSASQTTGTELLAAMSGNLTLNNSNGVTVNSDTAVSGTLTVASGTVLTTAQSITVSGLTSGTGTVNATAGTITYNRSGDQTIFAGAYNALAVSGTGSTKTFVNGITSVAEEIVISTSITLTGSTVEGESSTVQVTDPGTTVSRVFNINAAGETVTISNMTIKGGDLSSQSASNALGGGIYIEAGTVFLNTVTATGSKTHTKFGGGIYNAGTLTVTSSIVIGITGGSGIYNSYGNVTITSSTFSGNTDNGIYNDGGTITVTSSTFSGNTDNGIYNDGGTITVTSSTVSGNFDNGIYNDGGTITVTSSTFSGNTGPGIYNVGDTITVTSSTFSGNAGPGIYNVGDTITVTSSTFSGNADYGIVNNLGTLIVTSSTVSGNASCGILNMADLYLLNSVVAGNYGEFDLIIYNGTVTGYYNWVDNISGTLEGDYNITADYTSNDLYALADYGGTTLTMLPGTASPVINAGTLTGTDTDGKACWYNQSDSKWYTYLNAETTVSTVNSEDQRGESRPDTASASTATIGSVQFQTGTEGDIVYVNKINDTDWTVVTTEDDIMDFDDGVVSLREALSFAASGSTITFADGVTVCATDIVLPFINRTLTVDGNDLVSISGDTDSDGIADTVTGLLYSATTGDLTLKNITVTKGYSEMGGAIKNEGTLTITSSTVSNNTGLEAGAIYNEGTLTITDSTVNNNTSNSVGAIYNDGTMTITDSTVNNNTSSKYGGAIGNEGTMTITDSTVSNNTASSNGGGIFNYNGTLTITGSTVSSNTSSNGGGIYNNNGTLTITDSTVSSNTSSNGNGGGIYVNGGTLTITDSTVSSNNSSNGDGGGIYVNNGGILAVHNSTINNNTASGSGGGIYMAANSVEITSSTISNNSADTGGGIYNWVGTLTVTSSTVSGNNAVTGGGIYNLSFDADYNAKTYITNSIVAYNYLTDQTGYDDIVLDTETTLYGNYSISGYDLNTESGVSTNTTYIYTSGKGESLFAAYDEIAEDTIYAPVLADNGGDTYTAALADDSIAIETGVKTGYSEISSVYAFYDENSSTGWYSVQDGSTEVDVADDDIIKTDQRGFTIYGTPSIGAYYIYYPELGSFVFANIGNQTAGITFNITVTAYDQYDNIYDLNSSSAVLSDLLDGMSPVSVQFTDGICSCSITLTVTGNDRLSVVYNGITGTSNMFTVATAPSPGPNPNPNPGIPDINNGMMINDGTLFCTRTSWRATTDSNPSNAIDDHEGFEPNEVEGIGLAMDSLITFDVSAESVANGEYSMTSGILSGGLVDGEYEIGSFGSGTYVMDGEYDVNIESNYIGAAANTNQEFNSEYDGIIDLSFDLESDNTLINYEAIAAYNDRHPLFKTELDLLLEKI